MDYEAIDKAASFYCKVAQDSKPTWSVEDVCIALRHPMPATDNDLKGLIRLCDTWSIRCNIDQDPVWQNCLTGYSK
jgi:hypothetical protein